LSPLTLYFRQLKETPLLSAEQERELACRFAAGDFQARNHLVRANLRPAVRVAQAYQGRGLELADLIAEGSCLWGHRSAVPQFENRRQTKESAVKVVALVVAGIVASLIIGAGWCAINAIPSALASVEKDLSEYIRRHESRSYAILTLEKLDRKYGNAPLESWVLEDKLAHANAIARLTQD
jgi:hypothetical protein